MGPDDDQSQSGNSGTRFKNFTVHEDLLLCSAWSNATNDAIVGIDQHGDAFWTKAHSYWLAHKNKDYPTRHPIGLMQRFSRIRTAVNKFCGYLAQVELLSGYTEIDKIAREKEMYLEFEVKNNAGKKNAPKCPVFPFEHCWKVLKNDQKWLKIYSTKKPTNTEDPFTISSPIHMSLDGEDTSSTPKAVKRPVGRKLAKEGRTKRKEKFAYDNSTIIEKMDQTIALNEKHHNDDAAMLIENDKKMELFLGMQRENLDLKKMKLGMEKQMFDVDIALKEVEFLKVDISSLNDPDQIDFYQKMKQNIKAISYCTKILRRKFQFVMFS